MENENTRVDFDSLSTEIDKVEESITFLRDWANGRRLFEPEQVRQLLEMSVKLMEHETSVYGMYFPTVGSEFLVTHLAMRLRGLRDTLNKVISTSIFHGIEDFALNPADYEITVEWLENGFVLHMPYAMVGMSSLFLLRSKRLSKLESLNSVWHAWGAMIRAILKNRPTTATIFFPLASVQVDIYVEHRIPLDPDEFWVRPILDALVSNSLLVDDDANNIIFMMHYHMQHENPRVTLSITSIEPQEMKNYNQRYDTLS